MADVLTSIFHRVEILVLILCTTNALQNCTTLDGRLGQCVEVGSCTSFRGYSLRKSLTSNRALYYERSQCDDSNNTLWVCCADSKANVRRWNTRTSRKNRKPTGYSKPSSTTSDENLIKTSDSICGRSFKHLGNRIFGGRETYIGEFPWMALLAYEKPNARFVFGCAGALITNKHVLTAAHCVIEELLPTGWKLKKVRLGEWDRRTNPDCQEIDDVSVCALDAIDIDISRIIPHEQYDSRSSGKLHDIAILDLEYSVAFTDFVRPICLPINISISTDYGSARVVGFGKTENNTSSPRMITGDLDIVNHEECKRTYRIQGRIISDKQFCGMRSDVDTCNGDSGSPMMRLSETYPPLWYLIGVTSFGPLKCANSNIPGVYTNVLKYLNWIENKLTF